MQRLDRFLSEAGVASRRELRAIIRAGRVRVNDVPASAPEQKIDETSDRVTLDGEAVGPRGPVVLLLHKPTGYVTSTDDPRDRTVMELIPERYRKFGVTPVGRLDKETEGLLLLTNDGAWAQHLLHPKHEVEKTYHVSVFGPVAGAAARLAAVTDLEGEPIRPARVEVLRETPGTAVLAVTIHEGKNRQVRRMCAQCGLTVKRLRRVREGALELGDLPPGKWRYLTQDEAGALGVTP